MMRLAVQGEEATWRAVASRLQGATVVCCFDGDAAYPLPDVYDAVLFVSSRPTEYSWLEQSLAHGKHVLVADASWFKRYPNEATLAIVNNPYTRFSIVNPAHYLPSRHLIKQQIDDGKLGTPGLVRIHRWEAAEEAPSATAYALAPLVLDIELATWLIGAAPQLIYATEAKRIEGGAQTGRTVQVHVGFVGGAMALVDFANGLPAGDGYQSLSVIGSAGAAYADDHQNVHMLYQGQHPRALRVGEELQQWTKVAQEFVDTLQSRPDLMAGMISWNNTVNIGNAVEKSLRTQQAISVEELWMSSEGRLR